MKDLNDPDGVILEICNLLLNGDNKVPSIRPMLCFKENRRKGKFEAIVESQVFDLKTKKTTIKKFEVGEGRTVSAARADLLQKLTNRAQAVIDLPVTQVMES